MQQQLLDAKMSLDENILYNVGSYDIQIGSLFHKNYSITFVKNTLTIEPKTLDIFIDNIETTYGQNEALTYHTSEEYMSEFIYGNLEREIGEDVGEYEISAGTLTSKNYRLNITNAIYKINPKKAYVKALNVSKTYGDDDILDFEVSGLLDGDGAWFRLHGSPAVDTYRHSGLFHRSCFLQCSIKVLCIDRPEDRHYYSSRCRSDGYVCSYVRRNEADRGRQSHYRYCSLL